MTRDTNILENYNNDRFELWENLKAGTHVMQLAGKKEKLCTFAYLWGQVGEETLSEVAGVFPNWARLRHAVIEEGQLYLGLQEHIPRIEATMDDPAGVKVRHGLRHLQGGAGELRRHAARCLGS